MAAAAKGRKLRWLGYGMLALLLLVLAAGFVVRQVIDAERLSEWLVLWLRDNAGLSLEIGGEVELNLLPRPYVSMEDVHLARIDGDLSLFRAARIELELPYAVLWSDSIEVYRLRLVSPDIDINRLAALGGEGGEPGAIALPALEQGLVIQNGTLRAARVDASDSWRIGELNLETGPFAPGELFDMRANLRLYEPLSEPAALDLQLSGVLIIDGQRLRWEQLAVRSWVGSSLWLRGDADLEISGRLSWNPDEDIDLGLRVRMSEAFGTALELPLRQLDGNIAFTGQPAGPAQIHIDAEVDQRAVAARLQYREVSDWLTDSRDAVQRPPLALLQSLAQKPFPGQGNFSLSQLRLEGLEIDDLRLQLDEVDQAAEPESAVPDADQPALEEPLRDSD